MKIILADVLGYCMGVRRAVDTAVRLLSERHGENVYSLGPLIHNQAALDSLAEKGLRILDEAAAVNAGAGCSVIIRAHGVPPETKAELEKRGCAVVDATCPRVTASQKSARKFAGTGYTVLLAGDRNHGEVRGIAGYAGKRFVLVESAAAAEALPPPETAGEKAVLLSQTTFSPEEFRKIAAALAKKYRNLTVMNTICPATRERQEALAALCPQVDGVIVVGGRNSANTRRLLQTAQENCRRAVLIERAEEIPDFFFGLERVGVTAGASTPDSVIREVRDSLERNALPVRKG